MLKHFSASGLAVALALFAGPSQSAGIFWGVDDAATLDRGQCHFESWVTRSRFGSPTVLVAAPACTTPNGIELTAFGNFNLSRTKAEYGGVQLKSTLYSDSVFSLGASLSVQGGSTSGVDAWLINIPATFRLRPTTMMHLNFGRLQNGSGRFVWGAGLHHNLSDRIALIAERRLAAESVHESQVGVRWSRGGVAIDAAYARGERGNPDRRWTLGMALQF